MRNSTSLIYLLVIVGVGAIIVLFVNKYMQFKEETKEKAQEKPAEAPKKSTNAHS